MTIFARIILNTMKVIDILGIVLPAFIIILGIIRIFVQKTKGVNGLIMFFAVLLLFIGLARYLFFPGSCSSKESGSKTSPLAVSRHSQSFNQSFENMLNAYYKMTDSFAGNDTAAINQSAIYLQSALDSLKIEELKIDSLIYQTALQPYNNLKSEIVSIIADPSIVEKRGSLNIFSNELLTLLSTVHYDLAKLYWLECDRAFGEDRPGNWLSRSEKSINPYGRQNCAEIKSTINFVQADTTKKP